MVFSLSARQHQRQIRAGIDLVRQFGERMDRARQSGDEGARQAHFQPAGNDDDAIGSMNIKETTNISFSLSLTKSGKVDQKNEEKSLSEVEARATFRTERPSPVDPVVHFITHTRRRCINEILCIPTAQQILFPDVVDAQALWRTNVDE